MNNVKIKRVKRNKKKPTTGEKIIAGIGLGSTLLGGAGPVNSKPQVSQIVSETSQHENSSSSRIKQTLEEIFGVPVAEAAGMTRTPAVTSANRQPAATTQSDSEVSDVEAVTADSSTPSQSPVSRSANPISLALRSGHVFGGTTDPGTSIPPVQQTNSSPWSNSDGSEGESRGTADGTIYVYHNGQWTSPRSGDTFVDGAGVSYVYTAGGWQGVNVDISTLAPGTYVGQTKAVGPNKVAVWNGTSWQMAGQGTTFTDNTGTVFENNGNDVWTPLNIVVNQPGSVSPGMSRTPAVGTQNPTTGRPTTSSGYRETTLTRGGSLTVTQDQTGGVSGDTATPTTFSFYTVNNEGTVYQKSNEDIVLSDGTHMGRLAFLNGTLYDEQGQPVDPSSISATDLNNILNIFGGLAPSMGPSSRNSSRLTPAVIDRKGSGQGNTDNPGAPATGNPTVSVNVGNGAPASITYNSDGTINITYHDPLTNTDVTIKNATKQSLLNATYQYNLPANDPRYTAALAVSQGLFNIYSNWNTYATGTVLPTPPAVSSITSSVWKDAYGNLAVTGSLFGLGSGTILFYDQTTGSLYLDHGDGTVETLTGNSSYNQGQVQAYLAQIRAAGNGASAAHTDTTGASVMSQMGRTGVDASHLIGQNNATATIKPGQWYSGNGYSGALIQSYASNSNPYQVNWHTDSNGNLTTITIITTDSSGKPVERTFASPQDLVDFLNSTAANWTNSGNPTSVFNNLSDSTRAMFTAANNARAYIPSFPYISVSSSVPTAPGGWTLMSTVSDTTHQSGQSYALNGYNPDYYVTTNQASAVLAQFLKLHPDAHLVDTSITTSGTPWYLDSHGDPRFSLGIVYTQNGQPYFAQLTANSSPTNLPGAYVMTGAQNYTAVSVDSLAAEAAAVAGTSKSPAVTNTVLNSGMLGFSYNQRLSVANITNPTWSVSSGNLPPGLSLNPKTGVITGTPTMPGTYTITVQATSGTTVARNTYTFTIASASYVPGGVVTGNPGTQSVTISSAISTIKAPSGGYVAGTQLPGGLFAGQNGTVLNSAGTVVGSFNQSGTFVLAPGVSYATTTNTGSVNPGGSIVTPPAATVTLNAAAAQAAFNSVKLNFTDGLVGASFSQGDIRIMKNSAGTYMAQVMTNTPVYNPQTGKTTMNLVVTGKSVADLRSVVVQAVQRPENAVESVSLNNAVSMLSQYSSLESSGAIVFTFVGTLDSAAYWNPFQMGSQDTANAVAAILTKAGISGVSVTTTADGGPVQYLIAVSGTGYRGNAGLIANTMQTAGVAAALTSVGTELYGKNFVVTGSQTPPAVDPVTVAPTADGITYSTQSVKQGGNFSTTFTGKNLTSTTYFDVTVRLPGESQDRIANNWQQGVTQSHSVWSGDPAGTWTITGIRAHSDASDHSGSFKPVSASIQVTPDGSVSGPVVSGLSIDSKTQVGGVVQGDSYTTTISGQNIGASTNFDVQVIMPNFSSPQEIDNWQVGLTANHSTELSSPVGTWVITGIRAHSDASDHSGQFTSVNVPFRVIAAPAPSAAPAINGVQGYDQNTQQPSGTVTQGTFLILYGTFSANSDNRVMIDGVSAPIDAQTKNQINIKLPSTVTTGNHTVTVTNPFGTSAAKSFSVVSVSQPQNGPVVSKLTFSKTSAVFGSSAVVTITGTNLDSQTYFDVQAILPGKTDSVMLQNWQQGITASHTFDNATYAVGNFTIIGVRAHQDPADHSTPVTQVNAVISVQGPATVSGVDIAQGTKPVESLGMLSNQSTKVSALVRMSDGSITPKVTVSVMDLNDPYKTVSFLSAGVDGNGTITISSYGLPTTFDPATYQTVQQSASALLVIHPVDAGSSKAFDKTITVSVDPNTNNVPSDSQTPTMPVYIQQLAGLRNVATLSSDELNQLQDYFGKNSAWMPDTFIPGSFAATVYGLGENMPTSDNGLVLLAATFGYQYNNGTYTKFFNVPEGVANAPKGDIYIKDPATGEIHKLGINGLAILGEKASAVTIQAVLKALQLYASGSATLADGSLMVSTSASAAAAASHAALAALQGFLLNPATWILAGVSAIMVYSSNMQHNHYKVDDTQITNDVMQRIQAISSIYNSNRTTSIEDEQLMHDTLTAEVWSLFNGTAKYYKLQQSYDSQKQYVQMYVNSMNATLSQRVNDFQKALDNLSVFEQPDGTKGVYAGSRWGMVLVMSDGSTKSETGIPVPDSLKNAIQNPKLPTTKVAHIEFTAPNP